MSSQDPPARISVRLHRERGRTNHRDRLGACERDGLGAEEPTIVTSQGNARRAFLRQLAAIAAAGAAGSLAGCSGDSPTSPTLAPPTVVTLSAVVGTNSVRLVGRVNARGHETQTWFVVGTGNPPAGRADAERINANGDVTVTTGPIFGNGIEGFRVGVTNYFAIAAYSYDYTFKGNPTSQTVFGAVLSFVCDAPLNPGGNGCTSNFCSTNFVGCATNRGTCTCNLVCTCNTVRVG